MGFFWNIALETWGTLAEMAPYLIFGFLVAGLLSVFISPELVEKHLGGRGLWPVFKAALFGIPLPLCSCGVIPVGASLRRHGASRGAATSFLISTPQTGVDSILVTYSLLGPIFAIVRPVAALISGVFGGGMATLFTEKEDGRDPERIRAEACNASCCSPEEASPRLMRALRYGFVTLPQDIGRSLLLGLLIAGIIGALVPEDLFAGYLGQGLGAMLLMLVVGIPLYVCATGSVPIAAAILAKGISPGAVLVFLMTGPATNAAAFSTIWKVLGKRTAIIYLTTVALAAFVAGMALDATISSMGPLAEQGSHEMLPMWFKNISAVLLLGILFYSLFARNNPSDIDEQEDMLADTIHLQVRGMNCNHCVNSITRTLTEMSGVQSVSVDLVGASAVIIGNQLNADALCAKIQELGFEASPE